MDARALGFNFSFHDGLCIDGLAAASAPLPDATEVRLDPARVAAHRPPCSDDDGPSLRIRPLGGDGWLVEAPGAGAALVGGDGRSVWCAPADDVDGWGALLAAQIVPLVATLRGHEVFHAAGVVVDGRAHLLCAARGVGKTSLAAQLVLAGARLLADDVVAVDDALVVHPGPAVLHVRAAERDNVERRRAAAAVHWAGEQGGRHRLAADRPAAAHPLGGLHLLGRYRGGDPVVALARPRAVDLLGATFNLSVRTPERLVRQLELCARIAEEIPVTQLRIVPGRDAPELAAALLRHLRAR